MAAKFGDEWMKQWRTYQQEADDADFYLHQEGDCGDIDAGCRWCREAKEDQAKAQACADAFAPMLKALDWALKEIEPKG